MTIEKMCTGWAKGIASGEGNGNKRWQSCNVYYSGRTIYSYGSHFPMAYIVAPNLVWVNGDRFSHSTTRHQGELRAAISRVSDVTMVIVPNTALGAAGVDYKTIRPIDVHDERWEYTPHTSDVAPVGMSTELTEHVAEHEISSQYYRCDVPADCDRCKRGPQATYHDTERVTIYPAHDAPLRMGYGTSGYRYSETKSDTWPNVIGYVDTEEGRQAVTRNPLTGQYRWHTARHWLGDAVFTGERVTFRRDLNIDERERVFFISSFDKQERTPLYFLSQLPYAVSTVDAAIESLAPDSVKTAREMGRSVVRQGDMFAIPMDVTTRQLTKQGATFTKRKVTVGLTWRAQEELAQRNALEAIKATMPAYPQRRYYQQSDFPNETLTREVFDTWRKSYDAKCETWADELLARVAKHFPDVPEIPRYSWKRRLSWKPSSWDKTRSVEASALYGTAHTATEVATLPDGRQYARGIMYHDPAVIGQTREADHRRQKLGKQWHLVARNTVPVSGVGTGRRAA